MKVEVDPLFSCVYYLYVSYIFSSQQQDITIMNKSVSKCLTSTLFTNRLGEFTNKLEMKYFTMDNHSVILFSLSMLKVKQTKITVVTWKCKKN